MSLAKPNIRESRPFSEAIGEGVPFVLDGIRTVEANTEGYGKGTMVLLTVRGEDKELGIWGDYLIRQAESAEASDFGQQYIITRKVVEGFSKREVKALEPFGGGEEGHRVH